MRVSRPIGFFTASLLLGACQSLLLDDVPEKPPPADPPAASTATPESSQKSVVIRSRRDKSIKEISGAENQLAGDTTIQKPNKPVQSKPSPPPAAKPETDALDQIGGFFKNLFSTGSSKQSPETASAPPNASGENPTDGYKAPSALTNSSGLGDTKPTNPTPDGLPPKRIERRYSAAYGVYQPLAKKGHAFAQYELALMHLHGHGIAPDLKEAERWFRKAALQGHTDAKMELRKLIASGKPKAPEPKTPDPVVQTQTTKVEKPKLVEPATTKVQQDEEPPTVVISANSVTTTKGDTDSGTIIDRILPRRELPDFKKSEDQADLTKETGNFFSGIFGDGEKAPPPPNATNPNENKGTETVPKPAPVAAVEKSPEDAPENNATATTDTTSTSVKIISVKPAEKEKVKEKTEPTVKEKAEPKTARLDPAVAPEKKPETPTPSKALGASVLVEPRQAAGTPVLESDIKPESTSAEKKKNAESGRNERESAASFSEGLSAYNDGDFGTAYRHWQTLATAGEAESQTRIGYLYEHGKGVEQNYKQAVTWYQKAADQGEPAAQFNLGVMYRKGRGVAKNDKVARQWYEKAADQGHPIARRVIEVMKAYKIGE